MRSAAGWIASEPPELQIEFLEGLSEGALLALPYLFEFWAYDHQLPPEGDWRTWVIMGGRGAGKTRAGAEWVRGEVEGPRPMDPGRSRRVALVGETIEQVREVMVFGESGILACSPPDRRPVWEATRKRLVWPNGAVAQVYSAHDPDSLRGPQFDAAWSDELAKWKKAQKTWDMLQFALRLGSEPRQCVTTTPKNVPVLRAILDNPSTVMTHAPTESNRAFLADSFLEEVRARYAGTRLARQELDGVLLEDRDGALWTEGAIEAARKAKPLSVDRVVIAVDPPVTGHAASDECGIIVAGVSMEGPPQSWRASILRDASVKGASPAVWAGVVAEMAEAYGAERVVAEVNQGGDMVESVLRQVAPNIPYRGVRASRGKAARAEPVAALYEQGRVHHAAGLDTLEAQMLQMTLKGFEGRGSPDRVDALVWALHDLVLLPATSWGNPRVRTL
ncbi:DNA-packaging protein [Pseudoruegeria sp. SHC-113]|uniref:DNA-packaging protein n=1 Tax=Pseudoruegeria sp. SHC-113 TaxID=2855439 RepID=UPI0021BB7125|nr:terminase family protein [Pseudoruegeria sp. SHC-113]MCT8160114.1 terminase family protein [Pseudoruegeria sp. SHC-113]